jgi:N-methylhydantoinase B/oxoprolinase/acetone carboxylase alpha subunit
MADRFRLRAALEQSSFEFRPFGLTGGEAAAASALYLIRDGRREALPSKVTNVMLRKGDIVRLETSGGGRFGERKRIIDLAIEHRLATTMQ